MKAVLCLFSMILFSDTLSAQSMGGVPTVSTRYYEVLPKNADITRTPDVILFEEDLGEFNSILFGAIAKPITCYHAIAMICTSSNTCAVAHN